MSLVLESPAFHNEGELPERYTLNGCDLSPPLAWAGVPEGTASLVLIMEDADMHLAVRPDAPAVHWVVYNVPPDCTGLGEGMIATRLPEGAAEGLNDAHRRGYLGPRPRSGRHRYRFRLCALDRRMEGLEAPSATEVEHAMSGHVLAEDELFANVRCEED